MTAPAVADPWMNLHDAAAYCGFKHTGLRSCINRGELPPDGRGPRNIAMFRRSSLDRFLEDRARRMLPPESASGDRTTDGEISRRDADRPRAVPRAGEVAVPQNGTPARAREDRRGRERGRGGEQERTGRRRVTTGLSSSMTPVPASSSTSRRATWTGSRSPSGATTPTCTPASSVTVARTSTARRGSRRPTAA